MAFVRSRMITQRAWSTVSTRLVRCRLTGRTPSAFVAGAGVTWIVQEPAGIAFVPPVVPDVVAPAPAVPLPPPPPGFAAPAATAGAFPVIPANPEGWGWGWDW